MNVQRGHVRLDLLPCDRPDAFDVGRGGTVIGCTWLYRVNGSWWLTLNNDPVVFAGDTVEEVAGRAAEHILDRERVEGVRAADQRGHL